MEAGGSYKKNTLLKHTLRSLREVQDDEPEMYEAHFCRLEAQSNIYGLSKIDLPTRQAEILVASLRGENGPKVISLKIANSKPNSREIRFAYIPGDAEIISIDAFNKFHHGSNVVIGITFIKSMESIPKYYLNIYSELMHIDTFDLDSIAQDCFNIELNFVPYQLTHAEHVQDGDVGMVFLLSGSDHRIHVYKDRGSQHFTEETCLSSCFPEFENLPSSNVVRMDLQYFCDYQKRVSALGFIDGTVRVTEVNTKTASITKSWDIQHDSPITSVQLFTLQTDVECPHFVTEVIDSLEDTLDSCYPDLHLLVTSAIEPALIYRSVIEKGLNDPVALPQSDKYDCVLCSSTTDVDMDGQHEIILGTYGLELLVYKFVPNGNLDTKNGDSSNRFEGVTEKSPPVAQASSEFRQGSPKCPFVHKDDSQSSMKSSDSSKSLQELNTVEVKESLDKLELDDNGTNDNGKDPVENKSMTSQSSSNSLDTAFSPTATTNRKQLDANRKDRKQMLKMDSLSLKGSREDISFGHQDSFTSHQQTDTLSNGSYELHWQRSFADPVLAIDSMDLMGDGLEELVVLTLKGLHVLQHDPAKATSVCLERLKRATDHLDAFKLLQSEHLECESGDESHVPEAANENTQ